MEHGQPESPRQQRRKVDRRILGQRRQPQKHRRGDGDGARAEASGGDVRRSTGLRRRLVPWVTDDEARSDGASRGWAGAVGQRIIGRLQWPQIQRRGENKVSRVLSAWEEVEPRVRIYRRKRCSSRRPPQARPLPPSHSHKVGRVCPCGCRAGAPKVQSVRCLHLLHLPPRLPILIALLGVHHRLCAWALPLPLPHEFYLHSSCSCGKGTVEHDRGAAARW